MCTLFNNVRCYFIVFLLLPYLNESWAITVRIINAPRSCHFSKVVAPVYQVQIDDGTLYDSLPNNLLNEYLIDDNGVELNFVLSGFDEKGDIEIIIPEEIRGRLFNILTKDWDGHESTLLILYIPVLLFLFHTAVLKAQILSKSSFI